MCVCGNVCSRNLAGCLPVLDRGMIGAFAAAKAFFYGPLSGAVLQAKENPCRHEAGQGCANLL